MSDSTPQQPADPTGGYPPPPPAPPLPPYASADNASAAPPAYAPPAQPADQPAYSAPAPAPDAVYAAPSYAPAAPAYGQNPAYGYGAYPAARTNALAIVSLISGIAAFFLVPVIGSIAAVITGHISLKQLRTSGEAGRGMALAGTIIGWVGVGLTAIGIVFFVIWMVVVLGVVGAASSQYSYS